jgi:hypothetical protein
MEFSCFVWISEQTENFALRNIKKFYIIITTWNFRVLYGSRNKQQILPYATLKNSTLSSPHGIFVFCMDL